MREARKGEREKEPDTAACGACRVRGQNQGPRRVAQAPHQHGPPQVLVPWPAAEQVAPHLRRAGAGAPSRPPAGSSGDILDEQRPALVPNLNLI
jgi:hypothetical protein